MGKKEGFEKIFVIGGEKIYRESLPSCEEIFLTEVDANFDGDTFFPEIEWDNWIAVEKGNGRSQNIMDYGIVFVTLKEKINTLTFLAMLRLFAQYICHLYPCMIPNKPPIPQKKSFGHILPLHKFLLVRGRIENSSVTCPSHSGSSGVTLTMIPHLA